MKTKNKIIVIASIVMIVILASILISYLLPRYEDIDVIKEDDLFFSIFNRLDSEGLNDKGSDIIVDAPEELKLYCNDMQAYSIYIENKAEEKQKLSFRIEDSEGLRMIFPKYFIIPPNSIKEMTFFIDGDCDIAPKNIRPNIYIDGTDKIIIMNIKLEKR